MPWVRLLQQPRERRQIVDARQGQADQGQLGVRMRRKVFKEGLVRVDADDFGNGRQRLQNVGRTGTHQGVCLNYDRFHCAACLVMVVCPFPEYGRPSPIWIGEIQIDTGVAGRNAMTRGFGIFPRSTGSHQVRCRRAETLACHSGAISFRFSCLCRQARGIYPAKIGRINPQLACCTHQWDVNLFVYPDWWCARPSIDSRIRQGQLAPL